jgi:hypothetical protein
MPREVDDLASSIWGRLGETDAAAINELVVQIGPTELATRMGAIAHSVARGDIDPPSARAWLARQRPRHGNDRELDA